MIPASGAPEARLLVVDDEPNIRELLATSLRFAGFEVTSAADGGSALRIAREVQPDLVVLDVMLPDMDGFTVTRRLREKGQHVPVLFLTARDDTADKVQGLTVGGDDYVTKPFSLEELVARIRTILRRTGAAEQASSRSWKRSVAESSAGPRVRRSTARMRAMTSSRLNGFVT